ncbi:MAG: MFS transporter [Proteobacteria bacterium]|nr:MFS transporter [Pseudomonadota bacterium]
MNSNYKPVSAHMLLGFLILLNILNFVDRGLISSLAPLITADLDLTDTQIGLLTGFFFVIFYSFISIFMGTLADRFNRSLLMGGGLFLWSLLTAASGMAGRFLHLASARIFVGVGEASLTPAGLSMLSDRFPPEKRAFASGLYYAGIPLGHGLSLVIAGTIGSALGWRNCFYILGGVGMAMSLLLLFVKDPPRGAMESGGSATGGKPPQQSFGRIFKELIASMRQSVALIMVIVGSSIVVFGMGAGAMDQLWLVRERSYTQQNAALIFGVMFIIFGTLGNYIGGAAADWCHKRWPGGRLLFLAWMELAVIPITLSYRFIPPDTFLFYACYAIGAMATLAMYGPIFACVQDLVPIRIRSTSVGMLILGHNVLGAAPGPFVAGFLCDAFRDAGWQQPMTYGTFFTRIVGILAVPMFFVAARRYKADVDRVHALESQEPAI